jgi:hypothetical protein
VFYLSAEGSSTQRTELVRKGGARPVWCFGGKAPMSGFEELECGVQEPSCHEHMGGLWLHPVILDLERRSPTEIWQLRYLSSTEKALVSVSRLG